jgi:hypothetical protein
MAPRVSGAKIVSMQVAIVPAGFVGLGLRIGAEAP